MLPLFLAQSMSKLPIQQTHLTQSFTLLLLGATLSTLSTLNFSLALTTAALCSPLNFIRPLPSLHKVESVADGSDYLNSLVKILPATALYLAISPPVVLMGVSAWVGRGLEWFLLEMAKGWVAQGVWTALVVWGVWWPAWVLGGGVLWSGVWR